MTLVEIKNFSYTYPGVKSPILSNLNFCLDSGAFAVIIGKSGCGKSTLGKALAGFLFQDKTGAYQGEILVNQKNMLEIPLFDAIETVAYVQQNPEDQFCTLTVMDEIAFGLENLCYEPMEIEGRINDVLAIVQGENLKDRELATLSGGEQQKIAIASLLALSPSVLILDEPTSNLDPDATKSIFETLHNLREKQNLTVIIIEHKLPQLLPLDPDIFELSAGKLHRIKAVPQFNTFLLQKPDINTNAKDTQIEEFIRYQDVCISRSGSRILENINLTIGNGEFIALMGPNGSGKTTLLESFMGFHQLNSGKATIFNQDLSDIKTSQLVKDIGFIFQNPDHQLFTQSLKDEITFTSRNIGKKSPRQDEAVNNWLNQIGLSDRIDDHPQKLSYGEKRRLNLASAALHTPQILLIDELLIGQDMENALYYLNLLYDYTKFGKTVVLVTHHPDLVSIFCDRVIFLDHGKIAVDDKTADAFCQLQELGYAEYLPKGDLELANE